MVVATGGDFVGKANVDGLLFGLEFLAEPGGVPDGAEAQEAKRHNPLRAVNPASHRAAGTAPTAHLDGLLAPGLSCQRGAAETTSDTRLGRTRLRPSLQEVGWPRGPRPRRCRSRHFSLATRQTARSSRPPKGEPWSGRREDRRRIVSISDGL